MRILLLCEGTTDLILLQFVLQYKYGWKYKDFVENRETNRLRKRILTKNDNSIEVVACGGINNIPNYMSETKDKIAQAMYPEEMFDKIILLIDHDNIKSNKDFISNINKKIHEHYDEKSMNQWIIWTIKNEYLGNIDINLFLKCVPIEEIGCIENIMLDALKTDKIEEDLVTDIKDFINAISLKQNKYIQKKSKKIKAVFNTYFAIRTPEEKHDERSRILNAYNWEENTIFNKQFDFLDI